MVAAMSVSAQPQQTCKFASRRLPSVILCALRGECLCWPGIRPKPHCMAKMIEISCYTEWFLV